VQLNTYAYSNVTMRLFGSVLVLATAGQYYRLNAKTGETLLLKELTENLDANYTFMAIHKRYALMNSEGRVVALDRDRGRMEWESPKLGERFECAEVVGDRLLVACDGVVNVLDVQSGELVFSETFEGPRKAITLLGDETTFGPDRPLCFVGHCGKVHVIDIKAQKKLEETMLVSEDATFGVAMTLYRGILIASSGGIVMGFLANTYQECWLLQYGPDTGYGFMTSLQVIRQEGKDLALVGSNGYVVALDVSNGKCIWISSLPRGGYAFTSTLHYDGHLYAASNGRLWSLDPASGQVIWNLALSGIGSHSPLLLSTTTRNHMASDTPIIQAQKRQPDFSLLR
jgi:hypothetical protein